MTGSRVATSVAGVAESKDLEAGRPRSGPGLLLPNSAILGLLLNLPKLPFLMCKIEILRVLLLRATTLRVSDGVIIFHHPH